MEFRLNVFRVLQQVHKGRKYFSVLLLFIKEEK